MELSLIMLGSRCGGVKPRSRGRGDLNQRDGPARQARAGRDAMNSPIPATPAHQAPTAQTIQRHPPIASTGTLAALTMSERPSIPSTG